MDYEQSIPTVPVELVEVELTTRQAAERYGCDNYSTFHNRMVKLGIKPERRGRQSFLSQEQIQLLDRLDTHLKSGGVFGNFQIDEGLTTPIQESSSSRKLVVASKVSAIASSGSIGDIEIIAALQSLAMKNYDVLTPQKRLQEAVDNDFLLTTEQVGQILGLNANTVRSWKSETKKLGFTFHKEHENSSVVWRITRSN
jgi:hypothetical protein